MHTVNGEEIELAPNDFGFVVPEDLHGYKRIDEMNYRLVNLAFPPGCMMRILKRHSLGKDPLWGTRTEKKRIRTLSADDGTWLENELRRLRAGPQNEIALDHFLLSLVLRISPAVEGPFDKCPSWLRDACILMSKPENFRKGPKHFEVMSGRTLAHVSRVLRQTTGKTPVEWITEWRMVYAAQKLSAASEPIHEIAIECGFMSLSRFYSVFTSWHGMSPRCYRLKSSHVFPTGE